MSYTIMEQARIIEVLAEALRKREINFDRVPFDSIMISVQRMYEQTLKKGEEFVLLYGKQITKGLENRDYEAVADVLKMISYHFMIIESSNRNQREAFRKVFKVKCEKEYLNNLLKLKNREEIQGKKDYVPFQGKGVIYSAIIGKYDNVKEPRYINPDFDYILFTDNFNLQSKIWKIRMIDNQEQLDNVRLARRIKLLGHEYLPEYDYSIWVDGSLEIIDDLREYIECYKRHEPMLNFNHPGNDCIYDEMKACKALKKDEDRIMEAQIERYRKEGYPEHYGMIESGVMVRDIHNESVKRVMEKWWQEIKNGSRRDQLSFCYVCWKEKFMYDTCDVAISNNKYVKLYSHN